MKCCIINLVCISGFKNKQCKARGNLKLGCRTFLHFSIKVHTPGDQILVQLVEYQTSVLRSLVHI